jgi:GNAT superfamily N-acetyltransferase
MEIRALTASDLRWPPSPHRMLEYGLCGGRSARCPERRQRSHPHEGWLENQAEDHFCLFGAFDGERLAGFTGGAMADAQDTDCGFEMYYLFVDPAYRGQKLSLQLMDRLIGAVQVYRFHELVVYNFAESPSNRFYHRLGGKVRRSYVAEIRDMHCPVDVFAFDLGTLATTVRDKLG